MLSGKFFAVASAILVAAVNASPVEVAKRDTQPVYLGNVYFCDGIDWAEPCNLFGVDSSTCYNVPGGFDHAINSFGPDQGITCNLWTEYSCLGGTIQLSYPGNGNLSDIPLYAFGNQTSSFNCYLTTAS